MTYRANQAQRISCGPLVFAAACVVQEHDAMQHQALEVVGQWVEHNCMHIAGHTHRQGDRTSTESVVERMMLHT